VGQNVKRDRDFMMVFLWRLPKIGPTKCIQRVEDRDELNLFTEHYSTTNHMCSTALDLDFV
jgi:hypothetical protein